MITMPHPAPSGRCRQSLPRLRSLHAVFLITYSVGYLLTKFQMSQNSKLKTQN